MLSSALYHTMSCHSSSLSWLCLDQSSILMAVYGTSVKVIVNHFHCFPQQKNLHLFLVTLLFISALFLKVRSLISGLVSRVTPLVFLFMALHSVFIMAHWVYLGQHLERSNVIWMCVPYIMAGVGVFFYLSHIPESLCCSEFDIWGASHQIWHIFILAGKIFRSVTKQKKTVNTSYLSSFIRHGLMVLDSLLDIKCKDQQLRKYHGI